MSDAGTVTAGVLSLHNSKETKAILNAIEDLGHEPVWFRQENTAVAIRGGEVAIEPDVDIVVNRLLLTSTEQPAEGLGLAHIFDAVRPMLNRPHTIMRAIHKFAAATRLADAGLPVPDALLALSADRLSQDRVAFGDQAVYKTAIGTHGGGTWKVDLEEPVNPQVGHRYAFLQALLDGSEERPHDRRIYVVGDEVVGAMTRFAPDGDWRTNVALGGDVTDATDDLGPELEELAIRATDVIGLDYAGVDVIEGESGWYVLEVNPTAGFRGLFRATGRSPAPHIAKLAIESAGGAVDDERVRELSATLDDSVPACKPRAIGVLSRREEHPIIGYTEEIVVTGTKGSETVVAKADTGAARTSIDTSIAATIGAGPIRSMTRVKSGSVRAAKSRPVVDVVIGVGGDRHTVAASVEDRGHMDYPVLLGRDILENYQVDIRRRADEGGEADSEEEEEEPTGE